ncbi:type IV pili twitching motility protein PilT [Candidatus Giovannonibacteria bacterium RIFCSPLOWO2_01_FULL_46_32]|uniref:Type IV pili twitching motility protein PilT n=1 Tax=Candidatus Giovannonibacteria bacterium RIFCSPLOWO2_01_FULL_46_32 TaxID=1798353 RepID=A0A1F5XH64_9BACT|nr:MAG: type IV pili twitching motility protein PilT [Candidatus Giovannonibacteria bacterium RIFCSPLOWO2_01_FULL_46_32]
MAATEYNKLLEELVTQVAEESASDLHLAVGRHPVLRISGQLVPLAKRPILTSADTEGLVGAMTDKENFQEFLRSKEKDFSYSYKDKVRFRVNAYFQKGFVGAALRIVPYKIKTLEELNIPPVLAEFSKKEQGFFLVVGPTGHGKSTTLAALVDMINHTRTEHIITIEDPIEYIFTHDRSIIDQREVGLDTKDFHTALRSMFREDVNVAMIGEMRDPETMSAAVTAAETGHLVLSSLHTNNAAQTIDRIIDTFPGDQQGQIRTQLASTLIGIFSQRLIPRVSGGLIPAYELLISNAAVRNLIRENKVHEIDLVIETNAEAGMVNFNRSLIELVRKGEITMENALLFSLNPQELRILAGK